MEWKSTLEIVWGVADIEESSANLWEISRRLSLGSTVNKPVCADSDDESVGKKGMEYEDSPGYSMLHDPCFQQRYLQAKEEDKDSMMSS